MSQFTKLPMRQDLIINTSVEFDQLVFTFQDGAKKPIDFTGKTFEGEILDQINGKKLFDLTFNTPANDGKIKPIVSVANSLLLIGQKNAWYFVKVITGTTPRPQIEGNISVGRGFQPGTV